MEPATFIAIVLVSLFFLWLLFGITILDFLFIPYYFWKVVESIFISRRENFERVEKFRAKRNLPPEQKKRRPSASRLWSMIRLRRGNVERAASFRDKVKSRRKPENEPDVQDS